MAVIQGGPSSEAEVSRASAKSIESALREAGHEAVRLELDTYLPETLRQGAYDVVFPIAHGAVGEDGSLQGLLELLDIPYVGSNVLASALAMQKPTAKILFEKAGLPIAAGRTVPRGDASRLAGSLLSGLGPSLVVKPAASGSAIGVAKLASANEASLREALEAAWEAGGDALVEVLLVGREVTCGVLDLFGDAPKALPPTEVIAPNDPFFDFQARYTAGRSAHHCPAVLGDLFEPVQKAAVEAHRALGCRDFSRVDFVVAEDRFIVLEVNTLPGFTATSIYPEAAAVSGVPMAELTGRLATSALARGATLRFAPKPLPR